jgi:DNA modification methylase
MRNTILIGDCRQTLRSIPDGSVHCCVTSPPYWGLRDYGTAEWIGGDAECDHVNEKKSLRNCSHNASEQRRGRATSAGNLRDGSGSIDRQCIKCGANRVDSQIGLESTPDEFVSNMVGVFREVWRVLRDDGTLWMNLGDSYAGGGRGGNPDDSPFRKQATNRGSLVAPSHVPVGIKPKDLCGIPWRVAFALQADGWYLRQEIIWHKPSPMPESVKDRCTKAHEHIFLLSKQPTYFYDAVSVKEQGKCPEMSPDKYLQALQQASDSWYPRVNVGMRDGGAKGDNNLVSGRSPPGGRNKRSVWTVASQPFSGAHFATYPPALIEPCILAGTSAKGACPACGAPWVRLVEREQLKRDRPNDYTKRTGEAGTGNSCANSVAGVAVETVGWEPSCECDVGDPVPCVVLDPFGGAGTTAIVAEGHGRDWILCELNADYANDIAWPRIRQGWSPVTGKAKTPVASGQMSLFGESS